MLRSDDVTTGTKAAFSEGFGIRRSKRQTVLCATATTGRQQHDTFVYTTDTIFLTVDRQVGAVSLLTGRLSMRHHVITIIVSITDATLRGCHHHR